MAAVITSDGLLKWFKECGLISSEQRARRVVIDAETGNAVKVYVELYGTAELLNVKLPEFAPTQITVVGEEEEEYDSWGREHKTLGKENEE